MVAEGNAIVRPRSQAGRGVNSVQGTKAVKTGLVATQPLAARVALGARPGGIDGRRRVAMIYIASPTRYCWATGRTDSKYVPGLKIQARGPGVHEETTTFGSAISA